MGEVNKRVLKFSHAMLQSLLCLPIQKILRAPLRRMGLAGQIGQNSHWNHTAIKFLFWERNHHCQIELHVENQLFAAQITRCKDYLTASMLDPLHIHVDVSHSLQMAILAQCLDQIVDRISSIVNVHDKSVQHDGSSGKTQCEHTLTSIIQTLEPNKVHGQSTAAVCCSSANNVCQCMSKSFFRLRIKI